MLILAQALGVPLFPEQASDHARKVDHLFFYLLGVTGGVALLVCLLLAVFSILYRRRGEDDRTPRITGWALLEWSWTLAPLPIFASMFGWGLVLYTDTLRPPPDAFEVFVVGKQWMWKVEHQGGQREINELHLPVDRPVKLTLISEDVIHDFSVPAFRMKIDVLPGRYVSTWFQPTRTGKYHLFCNQYCGTGHAQMVGTVTVLPAEEYESWLREQGRGLAGPGGAEAVPEATSASPATAPTRRPGPRCSRHLYGRVVPLRGGRTTRADRDYIRESILVPGEAGGRGVGADHADVSGPAHGGGAAAPDRLHRVAPAGRDADAERRIARTRGHSGERKARGDASTMSTVAPPTPRKPSRRPPTPRQPPATSPTPPGGGRGCSPPTTSESAFFT